MTDSLRLKVVTPRGSLLDEQVISLSARSPVGEFCLLPEHRSIMSALSPGTMTVEQPDGGKTLYAVDRGFLEAGGDHVNVITERCIAAEDVDVEKLVKEIKGLEEKIAPLDIGSPETQPLLEALEWAKAQVEASPK